MLRAKKVSTQKNTKRQTARKTPMKMSAASDEKNAAISLRATCQMLRMGRLLRIAAGGDLRKDRLDVALLRAPPEQGIARSEARRVGKEGASTCKSRGSPVQ